MSQEPGPGALGLAACWGPAELSPPSRPAQADWRAAAKTLRAPRDAGIVRGYYGQNAPAGLAASTLADLAPVIGPPVAGTAASPYVVPDAPHRALPCW